MGPAITSPGLRTVRRAASAIAVGPVELRRRPVLAAALRLDTDRRSCSGSSSSGVTTTGPNTRPKSDCFTVGDSAGSCHSRSAEKPPISPSAPITAATRAHAVSAVPRDGDVRTDERRRVREAERIGRGEEAHRRRLHRDEKRHVGERILGVLTGAAAAEEERLQRLGREVEHAVAVDATDPAALERVVVRVEHAEAHAPIQPVARRVRARCGRSPRRRPVARP